MATREVTGTPGVRVDAGRRRLGFGDETKASPKTTEFWAMVAMLIGIFVAAAVSDTFGDVRAWTLATAVAVGYMLSRGLAKSGTKYVGGEDATRRDR